MKNPDIIGLLVEKSRWWMWLLGGIILVAGSIIIAELFSFSGFLIAVPILLGIIVMIVSIVAKYGL